MAAVASTSTGFTKRPMAFFVPWTRSFPKRYPNFLSSAAPISRRVSSGRSQTAFLKGPTAFFRAL